MNVDRFGHPVAQTLTCVKLFGFHEGETVHKKTWFITGVMIMWLCHTVSRL